MAEKVAVLIPCYNEAVTIGKVVRSMFRDIDADYCIMVGGDDTYPSRAGTTAAP